MDRKLSAILSRLPDLEEGIRANKELILTNLVMLGEIPSPTFGEENRMRYLVNRLTQAQLLNCSTDEVGNGVGILPGRKGDRNILVVAHMDSHFDEKEDHSCTVLPDYISSPGISDNAVGLAAVVTLPDLLNSLGITLDSNLILLGTSRSLGRGNIEGLRFFLKNSNVPITSGISVEGVKLGRLSYSSIGMIRYEISYTVPDEYDWTRFGAVGSIVTINEVINRILEIPTPRKPRTSIVFNSIESGKSFNTTSKNAILRLEVRSESGEMVRSLSRKIQDIASEVSSHSGQTVMVDMISMARPGGIGFSHPLAVNTREIMEKLGITPRLSPSTSELAGFIASRIPALTIGLTSGENLGRRNERVEISPIFKGIAQLIGIILAIDGGICDAS